MPLSGLLCCRNFDFSSSSFYFYILCTLIFLKYFMVSTELFRICCPTSAVSCLQLYFLLFHTPDDVRSALAVVGFIVLHWMYLYLFIYS